MKIVIYGLGQRFQKNKEYYYSLLKGAEIVAYVDKNNELTIEEATGKLFRPEEISELDYDYIFVTNAAFEDVKEYLGNIGVPSNKIINTSQLELINKIGKYTLHGVSVSEGSKGRILIFSTNLGFHGGAVAAYNAAITMIKIGYCVDIGTDMNAETQMIEICVENGIRVIQFEAYPFLGEKDVSLIKNYNTIISNTIVTIEFALFAVKYKPVILWVHESNDYSNKNNYELLINNTGHLLKSDLAQRIRVLCVSNRSKNAFWEKTKLNEPTIVPIAISDRAIPKTSANRKIVFAMVGYFREDKNQKQYIEAAGSFDRKCECWLVGNVLDKEYYNELKPLIDREENVLWLGECSYSEMPSIYNKTDVVVCASYEESLSITIVEGMMHSKICITTDRTGIADYIEDGVNGFICKAGDVDSLAEKMQYVIDHFDELDDMRKKARETYEKYFTLDILGDNLEREINEAIEKYRSDGKDEIISNCADF